MVFGCHGKVGSILIQLSPVKFNIIGVGQDSEPLIKNADYEYIQVDITKKKPTKEVIVRYKPRFIINSAALANVDQCEVEREKCWRVNVEGTENLVAGAKAVGARFIHLSTDFIFDGTGERYKEDDRANPVNYYGKSKLAGETVVMASGLEYAIIRTASLLHPLSLKGSSNFALRILEKLNARESCPVPVDELRSPTYIPNLVRGIWKLIQLDRSGVYHMAGREAITRYDFGVRLAHTFNVSPDFIKPVPGESLNLKAKRPLRTALIVDKAQSELCFEFYDIAQCLAAFQKDLSSGVVS